VFFFFSLSFLLIVKLLFTYIIIVFNLFCCYQLLVNKDYHHMENVALAVQKRLNRPGYRLDGEYRWGSKNRVLIDWV